MKLILLATALLISLLSNAQSATPPKGSVAVLIHTDDSAEVAYKKAVQGLLAQGFGIDKSDKDALFMSAPAKALKEGTSVKIQLVTVADQTGSTTTFRATYTWTTYLSGALGAGMRGPIESREQPVQYTGPGKNPIKRAWQALEQAATQALPAGTVSFN